MALAPNRRNARKILWIECVGFALLIADSWADEIIGVPHLLFGGSHHMEWREATLESLAIAIVWLAVFTATRRILRRFQYLESLLTMCAWCRKLEHGGQWLSLEDYCAKELGVDISHGLCPQCGRQLIGREAEKPG